MKKIIFWSLIYGICIIEIILLYTAASFFKEIMSFKGNYLDMSWYEEGTTTISSYLIFPMRYFYKHVILSILTGIIIYGGVLGYLWTRINKKENHHS